MRSRSHRRSSSIGPTLARYQRLRSMSRIKTINPPQLQTNDPRWKNPGLFDAQLIKKATRLC